MQKTSSSLANSYTFLLYSILLIKYNQLPINNALDILNKSELAKIKLDPIIRGKFLSYIISRGGENVGKTYENEAIEAIQKVI